MRVSQNPNQIIGKIGEDLAVRYLQQQGYRILQRNWRYRRFEIDVIAVKSNTLHFIEVKTRRSITYGLPEAQVTDCKIRHMMEVVNGYLQDETALRPIQLDIVAIQISGKATSYFMIEDIYILPSAQLIRTPHP